MADVPGSHSWRLKPNFLRSAAYLLAWPGMDAAYFFDAQKAGTRPRKPNGALLAKIFFGSILVWVCRDVDIFRPNPGWLGGNDRRDISSFILDCSSSCRCLAANRNSGQAPDAKPPCFDIAHGILGQALEHGLP